MYRSVTQEEKKVLISNEHQQSKEEKNWKEIPKWKLAERILNYNSNEQFKMRSSSFD